MLKPLTRHILSVPVFQYWNFKPITLEQDITVTEGVNFETLVEDLKVNADNVYALMVWQTYLCQLAGATASNRVGGSALDPVRWLTSFGLQLHRWIFKLKGPKAFKQHYNVRSI